MADFVTVENRSAGKIIYNIPDRHIRRELAPRQSIKVPKEEIEALAYTSGGMDLIRNRLLVKDDQMLDELNKETEGKYQKEIRLYQKQRAVDFNYRFRHYRNLKNYRDIYREFKGKMKYTYFLKVNAPRLYCFLQSTRNFLQRREKV